VSADPDTHTHTNRDPHANKYNDPHADGDPDDDATAERRGVLRSGPVRVRQLH
jgi:hypothetical protein